MGQSPGSGLLTAETNEIILQVGPGAQPKSFSFVNYAPDRFHPDEWQKLEVVGGFCC